MRAANDRLRLDFLLKRKRPHGCILPRSEALAGGAERELDERGMCVRATGGTAQPHCNCKAQASFAFRGTFLRHVRASLPLPGLE